MKDWLRWYEAYDDPGSALARRLDVVRQRLGEVLDGRPRRGTKLLSLCAGDGRDVIPVLAARPACTVSAVLVESNEELARRATQTASAAGLSSVEVRCGDAGDPSSFADVLPVDVLLLCGIFGNVEHAAVRDVIDAAPAMVAGGGVVIWTRGASEPDRRPEVRRWFRTAGFDEVAFDGNPEPYGVGVNRAPSGQASQQPPLPERLFTFVQG